MRTPERLARVIRRGACCPPPTLTLPHEGGGDDIQASPTKGEEIIFKPSLLCGGGLGGGGELHVKRARPRGRIAVIMAALWALNITSRVVLGAVDVDMKNYRPDCGVTVTRADERLKVEWPLEGQELGQVVMDLRPGKPLIERMAAGNEHAFEPILRDVDPVAFVVVGERRTPGGEPPGMSVFNVFFDSPAQRPFQRIARSWT